MTKFNVEVYRLFKEVCSFTVDAENKDEARDTARDMLSSGEADDFNWIQQGVESEEIETIEPAAG